MMVIVHNSLTIVMEYGNYSGQVVTFARYSFKQAADGESVQ
jgi:hypothetical protein